MYQQSLYTWHKLNFTPKGMKWFGWNTDLQFSINFSLLEISKTRSIASCQLSKTESIYCIGILKIIKHSQDWYANLVIGSKGEKFKKDMLIMKYITSLGIFHRPNYKQALRHLCWMQILFCTVDRECHSNKFRVLCDRCICYIKYTCLV